MSSSFDAEHAAFHEGERALQQRVGLAERMAEIGPRVIRTYMPDQHRELFSKLPMLVVGTVDAQGQPWASLLVGESGFVSSPDARTLRIAYRAGESDPLAPQLEAGAPLGLLGIELSTKRRNRMNGVLSERQADALVVEVRQSFGNCPKYIVPRELRWQGDATLDFARMQPEQSHLSQRALELIRRSDTFFIASASPAERERAPYGVDASHRGGPPGFVGIEQTPQGTVLVCPDYVGNYFFNTLGNLMLYPRAGLLFVDFARGDLLSLTVHAEVVWPEAEPDEDVEEDAIERWVRFRVVGGFLASGALPLQSGVVHS